MNSYEIIKELAKQKKLSIRQLEMNLGYSNGYLAKWRINTPNSDELKRIADYFNVSVDYLLGRTDNPEKNIPNDYNVKPKVKILSRKMNDLDDSQLDALDGLIDSFFDKKFNKKD